MENVIDAPAKVPALLATHGPRTVRSCVLKRPHSRAGGLAGALSPRSLYEGRGEALSKPDHYQNSS